MAAIARRIGVVPYKMSRKGPRVLLVTSLTRNRWVFPKGVVRAGEPDTEACQREAFEEAGVRGLLVERFQVDAKVEKSMDDGLQKVPVTFYPLLVDKEARRWPEDKSRKRRWFLFRDVVKAVDQDTAKIFKRFAALEKADRLPFLRAGESASPRRK